MRIASWNVNSLNVRLPQVIQWLTDNPVDVLALQELKMDQDKFPLSEIENCGYKAVWYGQKTYNGVALLTHQTHNITDVTQGIPGFDDSQRRVISATIQGIRIINVYCVNGESVDSEKFTYKLNWFRQLTQFIKDELTHHKKLVILGDFNIAPADLDVYDPTAWQGKVLCSAPEREAFQALLSLGLHDSLRALKPDTAEYSWWDYRAAMFRRNLGMRIDHILISSPLMKNAVSCNVDKTPRRNERPSDHAPIVLNLNSAAE